jgi:hypothetical protein
VICVDGMKVFTVALFDTSSGIAATQLFARDSEP